MPKRWINMQRNEKRSTEEFYFAKRRRCVSEFILLTKRDALMQQATHPNANDSNRFFQLLPSDSKKKRRCTNATAVAIKMHKMMGKM